MFSSVGPKIYFVLFCYIWRVSWIKIQNFLQPWWTSPVQKVYFILCGLPWTFFNHYNIVKFPWGRIYHNKWYVTWFDFGPAQSELGPQVIHPLPVSSSDWLGHGLRSWSGYFLTWADLGEKNPVCRILLYSSFNYLDCMCQWIKIQKIYSFAW